MEFKIYTLKCIIKKGLLNEGTKIWIMINIKKIKYKIMDDFHYKTAT